MTTESRCELLGRMSLAHARSSAHAADIAAGKAKAELCVGCHGENGISQMENIPSLAGQPDQFIQWQLVFFRAGTRKNEQMQPIVEQLNNEDIRNLGAYFASLDAAQGVQARRRSGSVQEGRAGRRRAALRVMPHRQLRRHQGGRPRRRPARGISAQGAARLQVRRAIRRRHGGDGGCRLSPERRRNRSAGALSRAFVMLVAAIATRAIGRRGRAPRAYTDVSDERTICPTLTVGSGDRRPHRAHADDDHSGGGSRSPPLLLIRLEMRVGDAQLRHRNLCGIGARDQVADHVVGLDRQRPP